MTYKPSDFTDVGQATVLAKHYGNTLRYSHSTGYLRYDGRCWQESNLAAQQAVQTLTDRQLDEANDAYHTALLAMQSSGAEAILNNVGKNKATTTMSDAQKEVYPNYLDAKAYQAYALDRRSTQRIAATLHEARPKLQIDPSELDANPYLLCTPAATYDLRKGMQGARKHSSTDYITKITSVSPGRRGADLWQSFLQQIYVGDQELIDYVQLICGLAAIGKVLTEAIVIAYGGGRNGKSTLCNTIARVLGTYSGSMSTDVLVNSNNRNIMPDLAELRGKRLILASELPCNVLMDDATIKHLCSTDNITGAPKYKDQVTFRPSHTLILSTNHLPDVRATDDGMWRRMIVVPFTAKIQGKSDVKNYSDYLYQNAAPAILAWIIEGARKVIALGGKITPPQCVFHAIANYRTQNDWWGSFLATCCELGATYRCSSPELYQAYLAYCRSNNRRACGTKDFYFAIEKLGYCRIIIDRKRYITGLRLRTPDEADASS